MKITLGGGERLLLIGHDVAILCPGDDGEQNVYAAADWRAECSASYQIDEDGDLRRHNGRHLYGPAIPYRFARCPSEERRLGRLFGATFPDNLRIAS